MASHSRRDLEKRKSFAEPTILNTQAKAATAASGGGVSLCNGEKLKQYLGSLANKTRETACEALGLPPNLAGLGPHSAAYAPNEWGVAG